MHAGRIPLEKEFEDKNPGIDVLREAAGSQKSARKVSDLKKECDIMASADYRVIDKILIPEYADWNVRFATNQLVLTYTEKSRYADKVSTDNWYEVLQKEGVEWGHSAPDLDPCGYRSLMVMQLAEKHYRKKGLYERLIANRKKENIRPKSVELISLLQTGHMDYAWEYLSVAVQHKLKYIILPDEINLGNSDFDSFYSQSSVELTGKKPGTKMNLRGKSVTYGITLIKNAPNKEGAVKFLQYLLSKDGGLKILREMGQPPVNPPQIPAKMSEYLPEELNGLTKVIR